MVFRDFIDNILYGKRMSFHRYRIITFYEVCDLFDIYQKEIEEKNKQAKKDNEQMEMDMANMQSNMNRSMTNNPMSNISMPKMPNLPSL